MFRHQGKTRTLSHNLRIASLLSSVDEIFKLNFWQGFIYFLYIFFFFLGSFVSNFLLELISRKDDHYVYVVPASIECFILFAVGVWGHAFISKSPNAITFSLLFAMGLQNSLVTTISSARVRTTHLTGLFTDLGIELSQLLFYKQKEQKHQLFSSIKLRLTIISFFFMGGIVGGVLYSNVGLHALIVAAVILAGGLIYDSIKFRLILLTRKLKR